MKTTNYYKVIIGSVVLSATGMHAHAAVMASYNFNSDLSANSSDTNVTAGAFTEGTSFAATADAGRSGSNGNLFARGAATIGGGSGDLAMAITAGDYFGFSIDVGPGFEMDLTTLDLKAGYTRVGGNNGKTFTANLLTSIDGFTSANLIDSIASSATDTSGGTITQDWSIDLSAAKFQGLTSAATVEFRFYLYDDTSDPNTIHRLDDIVLNGTITAVPEPSSTALFGLGSLALILRRRR